MQIPTFMLRTPIQVEASLGNTGDGDAFDPPRTVKAFVKHSTRISSDSAGQTITVWSVCLVRRDTVVKAGDRVTVDGFARTIASVDPVHGPGGRITHYELVAGDG